MTDSPSIDLGFATTRLPAGTHICQIYSDPAERTDSLLQYLASGIKAGERTACFSDTVSEVDIERYFSELGIGMNEVKARGAFRHASTREVYFQGGKFEPERMLELLREYQSSAVADGFSNARVIGEMVSEIDRVPGGSRLMEYESRVSLLLREHPVTAVCQYDARAFDGATLMDVLKVHPMMVIRGTVVHNPFFIPPEEFLRE